MSGNVISGAAEAFADSRDPRHVYAHGAFRAVSAELAFTRLSDREGVTLVLGPPGAGKSTLLIRLLAEQAAGDCNLYVVGQPDLSFDDFIARCAQAFGLPSEFESREACMRSLSAFLLERQRSGGSAVLIIDQADRLAPDFLAGLASFARLSKAGRRLSHVILAARLCDDGDAPALEPLADDVAFRCLLKPLSAQEMAPFLRSRLQGFRHSVSEVFDKEAISRLYHFTEGLPQRLVQLGAASLRLAAEQGADKVGPELVEQAWRDLASDRDDQAPSEEQADRTTTSVAFSKQVFPTDAGWNLSLDADEVLEVEALSEAASDAGSNKARRRFFPLAWRIVAGTGSLVAIVVTVHVMTGQMGPRLLGQQTAVLPSSPLATKQAVLQLDSAMGQGRPPVMRPGLQQAVAAAKAVSAGAAIIPVPPPVKAPLQKSPLSDPRWRGRLGDGVAVFDSDAAVAASSLEPRDLDLLPLTAATADSQPDPVPRVVPNLPETQAALASEIAQTIEEIPNAAAILPKPSPPLWISVADALGREAEPVSLEVGLGYRNRDQPDDLSLFVSGLPIGAGLSAGVELEDGRWRLEPAALAGLTLTPPRYFSGKLNLRLDAEAGLDGTSLAQAGLEILIEPAPAALSLVLPPVKGVEDEALPLTVETNLGDRLGTKSHWIEIAGLPRGARLSAGRQLRDDTTKTVWRLALQDLQGLQLHPPPDFAGKLVLQVKMGATDSAGQELLAQGLLPVRIEPQADAPNLVVRAPTGREDEALPLTIKAGLRDRDGSEVLRILISGLPPGARLSAGRPVEYGAWLLAPGDLKGLEFLPPVNFTGTLALEVFAMADEPDGGSAQRRRDLLLAVEPAPLDTAETDENYPNSNTFLQKLIERGDELLALKDVVAARLYYERAASRGDFRALASVGRTYDPLELDSLGLVNVDADQEKARTWYLRGVNAGDPEAVRLWEALVAGEQSARLE